MMHQPSEEVLLVDFCDDTCPLYEHEHEICEDVLCPYQRAPNGVDHTHLHEAHPRGQPPRPKIRNNMNNHAFPQQTLDMRSINQQPDHCSWSATARSPPSVGHHDHRHGHVSKHHHHGHDRNHRHHDRPISTIASSYSFDGLNHHAHYEPEYSSTSCSTPRYDVHYDMSSAVIPLGPPLSHTTSMGSPAPAFHRTPDSQRSPVQRSPIQRSPIQRSPVLSMRSSVSSRSSDTSLSTLGSQSPAISGKLVNSSQQVPTIIYSQPIEPLQPTRSVSQPVVPALVISDNHQPHYHQHILPQDDYVAVPAILPSTDYQSCPKPLVVHTGLTSPALLPIQPVPAVEITSSPLSTTTPCSASMKKRRRDTLQQPVHQSIDQSPLLIPRGAVTDTHFYGGKKHFAFGSPVPSSGPSSAVSHYAHTHRRPSTVSTASYTGDESPVVPVLLLPRSAVPIHRDASVPLISTHQPIHQSSNGRRTSVSYHKPHDGSSKRRKSVIDPSINPSMSIRSPVLSPVNDQSLLQLVKLHDPYRAMVVACVHYLVTNPSIHQSTDPLHMKARSYLHNRFPEASSSPWIEPVITHALWVHERGWSDYSLNCPRDIHIPSMAQLPSTNQSTNQSPGPSPSVQYSESVIPRFSELVLDQQI